MLNEFRIEVAEPGELVLIQVHHEELVRGCEIRGLGGKLERKKGKRPSEKATLGVVFRKRAVNNMWGGVN
jgi:hypothetical protein